MSRLETWNPVGTTIKRRGKIAISPPLTGEPNASNTGLNVQGLTTADLTVVTGDLTVDNAYLAAHPTGTVDKLWVKGHLLYTATSGSFTFTNSQIEGRTFTGTAPWEAIIRARNGGAPATSVVNFVNCKVTCVQPDVGISSAAGERLGSFTRCDISLGSDLLDYWYPAAPLVYQCYLHDYSFWKADPKHTNDSQHPGWNHPDLIQNSGSNGGVVQGNSFDIRAAAGVGDVATLTAGGFPNRNYGCGTMLTPGSGHITNIQITGNWYRNGEVHVAMPFQNTATDGANSWTVSGNQHDLNLHGYGPYGTPALYSKQAIRWGYQEGPQPADVHDNKFLNEASVPAAWAGQPLPAPVVVGGTGTAGQYVIAVNSVTQ